MPPFVPDGRVALLALAIVVGGLFYTAKGLIEEVEKTQRGMDAVTERFGRPAEFRPDADGAIRPERIEIFLAVRDSLAEGRAEMERTIALLQEGEEAGGERGGGALGGESDGRAVPEPDCP
mgnify:CR=1 FL=1